MAHERRQVRLLDRGAATRRKRRRHAHLLQLDERVHAEPHLDKLAGLETDDVHHAIVQAAAGGDGAWSDRPVKWPYVGRSTAT